MPLHVPLYYPLPPHHPVTSSFPTPIGNPSPGRAVHPVADPPRRKPSRRLEEMHSSAPLSPRRPLLCQSNALYIVIPRLREGSRTCPFTSLSTTPFPPIIPSSRHPRPRSGIHPREGPFTPEAESKARGDALIRPPVTPTPLTLSSRGSARDLGLAHSRQSLPPRPTPNPFADSPKR